MKVYCITYDVNKRSPKTVYVSKNSTFQIGIKCYKDGELLSTAQLYSPDGKLLTSAGKLADYTVWTVTSGDKEASEQYKYNAVYIIKHPVLGNIAAYVTLPPLTIITTSSDVAEINPAANVDLSDYYTKEQVDAKVDNAQASADEAKSNAETASSNAADALSIASNAQAGVTSLESRVTTLEEAGYQTAEQVQQDITASLTDYSTTAEVNTIVTTAIAPLAKTNDLTAYWQKAETEEHQLTGTYEDGSEFSFTILGKKA